MLQKTSIDTYKLQIPIGLRLHPEFHTSLLKPYVGDPSSVRLNAPNTGMVVAGGDEGFLVENIVGHRKSRKGIEFLVKWQGYPSSENTWEPRENLLKPARHLIFEVFDPQAAEGGGLVRYESEKT